MHTTCSAKMLNAKEYYPLTSPITALTTVTFPGITHIIQAFAALLNNIVFLHNFQNWNQKKQQAIRAADVKTHGKIVLAENKKPHHHADSK